MILEPVEFDEAPRFALRDYQVKAKAAVQAGWAQYSRQLLDMATGTGKSSIAAVLAADEWAQGGRTLVLENRDALVRQTAKRIAAETGLETDIEMAGLHASPFASVVVASVPTLCRDSRLTGFSHDHFQLVICDEAQHSLSKSFNKVCSYFHYGTDSLTEGWVKPEDGEYKVGARILGVTATPSLTGNRHLGELYQHVAFTYQFAQAVADGWLVEPVAIMEPISVNLKGLRATRTAHGSDYNPTEVAERLIPIIEALAEQISRLAADRKTMAFMPSVNTAKMLADALNRHGLRSVFVSGECLDRDEKTEFFVNHGPGIALITSAMYTEGFDVPDVDCIFPGITKSRGYFIQKLGRATRALTGLLNGLETAGERRAAIAASAKSKFLIIDPFCRLDDIDICDVYDLYADRPEVKEKMKALGPPSLESAKEAERDFVKSLEKEARKSARKAAKTINPIAFGLSIGETAWANYVPQTTADACPPSDRQIAFMQRNHIEHDQIKFAGLADKIIRRYMARINQNLASAHQLTLLRQLGLPEEHTATLSKDEASRVIGKILAERRSA